MADKLDILVMASHPDDAELSCAGTILSHVSQGKKVGIVDFTKGELGSRGSATLRLEEAKKSAEIMNVSVRHNMGFEDGFFKNDREHQLALIRIIRKYKPDIVLANAISDRHTDHGKGALLAKDACFLSGLMKIETFEDGEKQAHWRPSHIFHYIQNNYIKPDFIVDVSDFWNVKLKAIKAFSSQFHVEEKPYEGPETFISRPDFLNFIEARGKEFGHAINVKYGEGFTINQSLKVTNLYNFL
jgi:N-acetylglucosamine malate deacetylase 1